MLSTANTLRHLSRPIIVDSNSSNSKLTGIIHHIRDICGAKRPNVCDRIKSPLTLDPRPSRVGGYRILPPRSDFLTPEL